MSVRTGVVIMTYGSPRDLDDVGAYMTRVRGGRAPSPELVTEFEHRYALIGMSPLISITLRQAAGMQAVLGEKNFRVTAGMRFSEPTIAQAVESLLADGAERILGLILSPQYSPILMAGYQQAVAAAAGSTPSRTVEAWHLNPAFIDVLASRIRSALASYPDAVRDDVPVLLTAHSLPKRVVDREPGYVDQLKETAEAVAAAADLAPERWSFVYQSAGHTPEEWLKPDMLDVLPELAAAGHKHVLVSPVQFLADHLETLYDVDIGGREQAEQAGIQGFRRTAAPNDAPDFVAALVSVVRDKLAAWEATESAANISQGATWAAV
jgi:protoporphyrin/coproporphyrin ferrochelatase